MKQEVINGRKISMIVLDVRLDNFYAFKNFHVNFTYPKKIVGSCIKDEFLYGRPNFRYKKVNVLFGANASGKTTFGRMLMKIFNFIEKSNFDYVTEVINDTSKEAFFTIDMASNKRFFYRVKCCILPCVDGKYGIENIKLEILKKKILTRDSYETCANSVETMHYEPADNYIEELEKIEELAWLFKYPLDDGNVANLPSKDEQFRNILENILKSLDPSVEEVKISNDVEDAYVIQLTGKTVIIRNKEPILSEFLSTGTKAGVEIAQVVSSLIDRSNGFYYCDEKFSYIHSEVEKALLSLMIECVGPYEQLFFTTHNTDVLDMNLPKHTFTFLRKDINNEECPISCIDASSLLKRNTDSLRNAVENDMFSTAPAIELIYSIAELIDKE